MWWWETFWDLHGERTHSDKMLVGVQWHLCLRVGLATVHTYPRVGAGLFLPPCYPPGCQGLFQGCSGMVAIEKETVNPQQVGWAQQSLCKNHWRPGDRWEQVEALREGCWSLQSPADSVSLLLLHSTVQPYMSPDLSSRSHIPSSSSLRLHHLLCLGTGHRGESLSFPLYSHSHLFLCHKS